MFKFLKKLQYGVRVLLSKGGGEEEIIDLAGRKTVLRNGGSGPTFVYLHSTMGESFMWFPFFQAWAKQFRVLVPTHPGFGRSEGFENIDTIEDMAFHYIELFDALGLDEVILGGVSLGGWIAAEIACRWPERVKKLWIAAAPGLWAEDQDVPDLFRHIQDRDKMRELLFHDPQGAMASLVIKDNPDPETMLAAYQSLTVLARLIWERPYNPKLAARLRRVQCPTLLLWGESDKLVPPAFGREYHKYLPHAEFKLIPECGHVLMFEKEAEFVKAIGDFASK